MDNLAHLLKIGLGRAVLQIKQDYDPAYRDTILHACLHNLAYDRQVEGDRALYMLEVIQATGDFQFYRGAILDALIHATPAADDYDIEQVYSLAGYLAEDGDTEMREAITQKFLSNPALGGFAGAHEIIALDGLAGFIYVAEVLSDLIRQHGNDFPVGEEVYSVDVSLLFSLEQSIGEDAAKATYPELRTTHPHITPVLDAIDEWRKPRRSKKSKPRPTYAEIKQKIQDAPPDHLGLIFRFWGEDATDAELRQAAQDLIAEAEPARLRRYLSIFWKRPFPLDPATLFPLARDEDFYMAIGAINALENIVSPDVRAFALECIAQEWMVGRMVGILQGQNHQPEDWAMIETLTAQLGDDDEEYHSLGFSVRDILKQHASPLAVPSLLNLYELNPCTNCREHLVEHLVKLNAVPSWMREECLHDANFDLREMMRKNENV